MNETKIIPLTQGKVAVVDSQDYDALNSFKWHALFGNGVWYAARRITLFDGERQTILMHRQIFPGVSKLDHRDGDGLNNTRQNLRPATTAQNNRNAKKRTDGVTSRFRGVCWNKRLGVFIAQICFNKKVRHLGCFQCETMAALAYDNAASKYFGEFARLNFV